MTNPARSKKKKKKKSQRQVLTTWCLSCSGLSLSRTTCALQPQPPVRALRPQLRSEPPLKGAGLLPLGPRAACTQPPSPAHGDSSGQTAPADPQQPGLPSHHQHRCQETIPHGGHGLSLHHVLRGGESGAGDGSWAVGWGTDPSAQATLPQAEEKASFPTAFLYFVRNKSDLQMKERTQKPGNRVGEPSGPQFLHRCQKLLWGRCE